MADRNVVYETLVASGTVYLTLDNHLVYWHRFEQHVKFSVVYDKSVPDLTNAISQGLTFTSNEHINYDRTCSNNLTSLNQIQSAVSGVECSNSKSQSIIDYALPMGFENQSTNDGNVYRELEVTACDLEHDLVPKELDSLDSFVSSSKHRNVATSPSSVDMFTRECENVHKSEEGDNNNGQNINIREDDLKKGKQTSERLSNITVKINTNCATKVFFNEKVEFKKCKNKTTKIKEDKVHMKMIDKKTMIKTPMTRLNNRIQATHKKLGNHETCRIPKPLIGKVVEKPRAAKVRKLELQKDVKCEYCLETFKSQQEYFDHRKGERTSFRCKICSKTVPFKAHLIVHMRKHNILQEEHLVLEEVDYKSGQNLEPKVLDGSGKGGKQIKCDVCGLVVSNIPILKTHMMMHTGEYAYKCCLCGEKTHSIAKHNNHLSAHLKSGKVQCKICNISFDSRSDLSKHQLTHEFKCSICDKVFPNKTSRVFHYKMVHKDEILKCMVCGKMFSSEEELTPHLKYHRNRAKTQCTVCGLFVTRLDNHILSHNQRTEDSKMYVCDQCPKQFKQKLSFQRHMRTHSEEKPYACIECSKRFARSGGLRRHMITHTQERPFVCTICGKACSQMGNLRIHMQIHKDISQVHCKVCGESFSYKHNLQEHMKSTHYADLSSVDTSNYVSIVPPDGYV